MSQTKLNFMSIILTPIYYITCLIIINIVILGLSYPIILLIRMLYLNNGWIIIVPFTNLYATNETNMILFIYCIITTFAVLNIIISVSVFSIFYGTKKYLRYESKRNHTENINEVNEKNNEVDINLHIKKLNINNDDIISI